MNLPPTPVPDFHDPGLGGSMVRCAAWLAAEVGEGGVFTKQQLRDTFPGVEQIDRRMRELRTFGWVIEESRTGSGLEQDELRLSRVGVPVWDRAARRRAGRPRISARVRQEVFHRDHHACVRCGAAAGECFEDDPAVRVRLTAAHVYPDSLRGSAAAADLVTACQRCNEAIREMTPSYLDKDQVLARVRALGRQDRERLMRRMTSGRRETDRVDDAWRAFLQLPATKRSELETTLAELLGPGE